MPISGVRGVFPHVNFFRKEKIEGKIKGKGIEKMRKERTNWTKETEKKNERIVNK